MPDKLQKMLGFSAQVHILLATPSKIGWDAGCHTYCHPLWASQRCKTRCRQHAVSLRVVPYWNKLPEEIVNAASVHIFKLRLYAR